MIFAQIDVGGDSNFAYLIADEASKEAAVVDPSWGPVKVLELAEQHGLTIKYLINTHSHYDHVDGNNSILEQSGAEFLDVKDGDVIELGKLKIEIIATPGHSEDSVCVLVGNKLITGDTLFVGKIGKTWSEADAKIQQESLHKLMQLPDDIEVYPGHDYGVTPTSTIRRERETNPFILLRRESLCGRPAGRPYEKPQYN